MGRKELYAWQTPDDTTVVGLSYDGNSLTNAHLYLTSKIIGAVPDEGFGGTATRFWRHDMEEGRLGSTVTADNDPPRFTWQIGPAPVI